MKNAERSWENHPTRIHLESYQDPAVLVILGGVYLITLNWIWI
ncbi:MAG TPA: hypothetical protein PKN70_08945 [Smithellaceae bacterium]|nr:hypothetical protein [Smithellaceae bacterium]HQM45567.1 hypothetical protein [Smithellaceae bacterium]